MVNSFLTGVPRPFSWRKKDFSTNDAKANSAHMQKNTAGTLLHTVYEN